MTGAILIGGCGRGQDAATIAPTRIETRKSPPLKAKRAANHDAIPKSAKGRVVFAVQTKQKVFALTFDDGPQPRYTRQVLDILKQNKIRATFFLIGKMVKEYPNIAREVAAEGHVIGNHTWSHPSHPKNPVAEFQRTDTEITRVLGRRPDLFRPPYGLLHNGLSNTARKSGDAVILWNCVAADWEKKTSTASISTAVLRLAKPGGIALLHDGGGNRSHTIAALPFIINTLRARGFRFVTVPELLRISPPVKMTEHDFWKKNGLKLKNGKVEKLRGKQQSVKRPQTRTQPPKAQPQSVPSQQATPRPTQSGRS